MTDCMTSRVFTGALRSLHVVTLLRRCVFAVSHMQIHRQQVQFSLSVASFVASTHLHRRLWRPFLLFRIAARHVYWPTGCNNLYSISLTKCVHLLELYRSWRRRCPSPEEATAEKCETIKCSSIIAWMQIRALSWLYECYFKKLS